MGLYVGVDQHVSGGNIAALKLTGPFTLNAWVNCPSYAGVRLIMAKDDLTTRGWAFCVLDGKLSYAKSGAWVISSAGPGYPNVTLVNGNEYMVTLSYDGTTFRSYVNMALDSSYSTTGNPSVNNADFRLASWDIAGNYSLNGKIDEARIYNRALTSDEIMTLYSCRGCDSLCYGLVSHWPLTALFKEGFYEATTAVGGEGLQDITASGYHLTAYGSPIWKASAFSSPD